MKDQGPKMTNSGMTNTGMKNPGMKNRSGIKNFRDEEFRDEEMNRSGIKNFRDEEFRDEEIRNEKSSNDKHNYFFLATLTRYFITVKLRTNIQYLYIIIPIIYTMFDTLNTFLNFS